MFRKHLKVFSAFKPNKHKSDFVIAYGPRRQQRWYGRLFHETAPNVSANGQGQKLSNREIPKIIRRPYKGRTKMAVDPPTIHGGRWVWSKHVSSGIGFFACYCQNSWTSSWADRRFKQQCKRCSKWVRPRQFFVWYKTTTLHLKPTQIKGSHFSTKCEACMLKCCRFKRQKPGCPNNE